MSVSVCMFNVCVCVCMYAYISVFLDVCKSVFLHGCVNVCKNVYIKFFRLLMFLSSLSLSLSLSLCLSLSLSPLGLSALSLSLYLVIFSSPTVRFFLCYSHFFFFKFQVLPSMTFSTIKCQRLCLISYLLDLPINNSPSSYKPLHHIPTKPPQFNHGEKHLNRSH